MTCMRGRHRLNKPGGLLSRRAVTVAPGPGAGGAGGPGDRNGAQILGRGHERNLLKRMKVITQASPLATRRRRFP